MMQQDRPPFFKYCPVCSAETPPGIRTCHNCGVDLEIARAKAVDSVRGKVSPSKVVSLQEKTGRPKLLNDFWYIIIGVCTNVLLSILGWIVVYWDISWGFWFTLACAVFIIYAATLGRYGEVKFYGFINLLVWAMIPLLNVAMIYYIGRGIHIFLTKLELPNPPKATKAGTIIIVILIIIGIISVISDSFQPSPIPTSTPQPTITKQPATLAPKLPIYPTPIQPLCLSWDQVTSAMEGQTICIYGIVLDYKENYTLKTTYFYFGSTEQFFVASNYTWNIQEGDCIEVTGKILLNTYRTPYIKADEAIYFCTSNSSSAPVNPPNSNIQSNCPSGCTVHILGCDIKGNISFDTGEKIYHLPGQEFYDATNIDPSYGERWFCTEVEAQSNGWRKSSN